MDAVSLKLARNYTNEKLNSLPSNRPTKTVSFDGGIYSVGNDVVNGQVSDVAVKGQTWTNRAGVGDTSPQTIASLDSAKTYLLIKTDGGTVNVDGVDTAVPAKITGKTSTVLTWASGKIALYELSTTEAALDAAVLSQKYHYVSGTKSTNSVRLRSVNVDETKESIAYVNLPPGEVLRSLPNGVKDEVSVSDGKLIKRVSNDFTYNGSEAWALSGTPYTNVYRFYLNSSGINQANILDGGVAGDRQYPLRNSDGKVLLYNFNSSLDAEHWFVSVDQLAIFASKTTIDAQAGADTLAKFKTWLKATLNYQLAEPIVTKLPAQAPLQVFENGTVYVEPIGDASESTLPSVEMTIPTGTSNKFGVASHDYDGAAADWTLTNNESKCFLLAVSNAGGAANIIAPNRPGTMYAISNASEYDITIKKSGGTGVAVTNAKTVLVIHNGTDYTALTAEL